MAPMNAMKAVKAMKAKKKAVKAKKSGGIMGKGAVKANESGGIMVKGADRPDTRCEETVVADARKKEALAEALATSCNLSREQASATAESLARMKRGGTFTIPGLVKIKTKVRKMEKVENVVSVTWKATQAKLFVTICDYCHVKSGKLFMKPVGSFQL
mmetsp:Transcript_89670/g.164388  ORF Transcript_89670/g.164388 Transcript_89670/m.164388 type:complete len:158 (-) Transcript_89670:1-474(-)